MRLVYVCRCCGKELTDLDIRGLSEGDYRCITEAELQSLREVREAGPKSVPAWRRRGDESETRLEKLISAWRASR